MNVFLKFHTSFSLYTNRLLNQFQQSKTDSRIQFNFLEDKSFPYCH